MNGQTFFPILKQSGPMPKITGAQERDYPEPLPLSTD